MAKRKFTQPQLNTQSMGSESFVNEPAVELSPAKMPAQ